MEKMSLFGYKLVLEWFCISKSSHSLSITKLDLVGTEKSCSTLIISPLVALMMNQSILFAKLNHLDPNCTVKV